MVYSLFWVVVAGIVMAGAAKGGMSCTADEGTSKLLLLLLVLLIIEIYNSKINELIVKLNFQIHLVHLYH